MNFLLTFLLLCTILCLGGDKMGARVFLVPVFGIHPDVKDTVTGKCLYEL